MICLNDNMLLSMLDDDCPYGDITTNGLGLTKVNAEITMTARTDMTLCGVEEAARLFHLKHINITQFFKSGDALNAGDVILSGTGKAGAIHEVYKVAQTFMEILSGIASATANIVKEAKAGNSDCHVTCTRKHMPGVKKAALKAINSAGASPHRLGLSDFVLIFAEHRNLFAPDISLENYIMNLRNAAPERKIAIESNNVAEALEFAKAGADIIQMDKVSLEDIAQLKTAFLTFKNPPLLSAAGGINAQNAKSFAQAGADILVTSQPYYAAPKDVKVAIHKAL
ncbi:ModD protein [Bartonella sp. HY329]|uniref:ModD protein n=1 Tax=unclassified Bartonella TaxID=2645622 RepID=UPI0021C9EFC6|nr:MULTISPECIES: ModD protein [unclassified Bartonella]UXM95670.1 ModD protein [Bartonella sp. HY329]UXN09995.1 ModD protein [Bartonella sp. HY328]